MNKVNINSLRQKGNNLERENPGLMCSGEADSVIDP